jgi:L-malate glycosyltransferase
MIRHIGIIGPINIPSINLKYNGDRSSWPKGMGGTPVNAEINALLELGIKVSVFSLSSELKEGDVFKYSDENIDIYVGSYRKKARSRCFDLFRKEINILANLILSSKPEILHAHWQYEWAAAGLKSKIECLITCHDDPKSIFFQYMDIYRLCRWLVALKVYKFGTYFTAVSPITGSAVRNNNKINNIPIIPNFVENSFFAMNKIRAIKNNVKIVMINNGFTDAKNVQQGILAFHQLNNPNFELHLYGKDHGKNEKAYNYCKNIGLKENVYFHGFVTPENLILELDSQHILVHPSKLESFGMVLIEAMAMGIPVIAGKKSGGVEWILEDGGGLLVDINNFSAIASAILDVITNYENLSKEAFLNVKNRFSKDKVMNQYLIELNKIKALNG